MYTHDQANYPSQPFTIEKYIPWLVTFSATLFFFYEFIQMNMFNAIDDELLQSFHMTATQLGNLSAVYFYANIIFLFPAGILLDRYSTKKIIISSMAVCVLGTLMFATATDYWFAYLSRFLTGIGSAFCFLSCIRLASRWFPPKRMAFISALIVTMAMIGGVTAQKPLVLLVDALGWRHALLIDAMLGLFMVLIIAMLVIDTPEDLIEDSKPNKSFNFWAGIRSCYLQKQNWFAALYTSFMNMPLGLLGVVWGIPFLTQVHHLSRAQAADITSMIFLGTIIGGPTVGWLSDNLQQRKPLMIAGSVFSTFAIAAILLLQNPGYWMLLALFFCLGFFTSSQVLSYPAVAENNPASNTGMATSVISFATQGGIAIYQTLFGAIISSHWMGVYQDNIQVYPKSAYMHAIYMIPLGFAAAFLISLFLFKETYNTQNS